MADQHPLLQSQLKRHWGEEEFPPECHALLEAINQAYYTFDADRELLERSADISSQELYQANALVTATLNSSSEGILVVDLAGKAILFNALFVKMWDIPPEIARSRNDERILANIIDKVQDPETFLLKVKQLYLSDQTDSDLIPLKDGRVFERFSTPLIQKKKKSGRVWNFRDITELRKTQAQLLQSEKMSAVGQLAAGVAHEINNPLGVILGFAQAAIKRIDPGTPIDLPLRSIEREALRCKMLVQNLLTFSRSGAAEIMELDLNDAIENSLSLVAPLTKVRNVEMVKELNPGIPRVLANPVQIQQVVVNLCNNAIDAMPNGGKLTVKTRTIALKGPTMVQIEITDTGQGIPKDIQSKIFEPFFTTKDVGKGTGLGLSLVFEIIQRHAGRITLASEVKKGTSFYVDLPSAPR